MEVLRLDNINVWSPGMNFNVLELKEISFLAHTSPRQALSVGKAAVCCAIVVGICLLLICESNQSFF